MGHAWCISDDYPDDYPPALILPLVWRNVRLAPDNGPAEEVTATVEWVDQMRVGDDEVWRADDPVWLAGRLNHQDGTGTWCFARPLPLPVRTDRDEQQWVALWRRMDDARLSKQPIELRVRTATVQFDVFDAYGVPPQTAACARILLIEEPGCLIQGELPALRPRPPLDPAQSAPLRRSSGALSDRHAGLIAARPPRAPRSPLR